MSSYFHENNKSSQKALCGIHKAINCLVECFMVVSVGNGCHNMFSIFSPIKQRRIKLLDDLFCHKIYKDYLIVLQTKCKDGNNWIVQHILNIYVTYVSSIETSKINYAIVPNIEYQEMSRLYGISWLTQLNPQKCHLFSMSIDDIWVLS